MRPNNSTRSVKLEQSSHVILHKRGRHAKIRDHVTELVRNGRQLLDDSFHSKYIFSDELLEMGANGLIYRAKNISGEDVVVKLLPEIDALYLVYILAPDGELWEAKIMRTATSNNVPTVKYLDSGKIGSFNYIVYILTRFQLTL
jgi:hypothetical protein